MNGCVVQLQSVSAARGATAYKLCYIGGHTAPLESTANEQFDGGFDAGVTRVTGVYGVNLTQALIADWKLVVECMKFVIT